MIRILATFALVAATMIGTEVHVAAQQTAGCNTCQSVFGASADEVPQT